MATTKTITTTELQTWIREGRRFHLIDTATPDDYAAGHLPGAQNACLFQVDFPQLAATIIGQEAAPVVVYANSSRSKASAVAAERLTRSAAGGVYNYEGGLEEWIRAHGEVQSNPVTLPAPPAPLNGTRSLDLEQSQIEWTGRNLAGKHRGTLKLASGQLTFIEDTPSHGEFVIDMDSIACADITDPTLNQVLIAHLKHEDFFETARHPTARFDLTRVTPIPDATPGMPNYNLTGDFTLKGITNPIEITALGAVRAGAFICQASFEIDRTRWNVLYGSGKFFERLGMHLVNDLISLELKIVTAT